MKKKFLLIAIIICILGVFSYRKYAELDESNVKITFYVSNKDATDFTTYKKRINNNLVEIIEELINNKQSCIPKETKVLDAYIKDKIAYINLNEIYYNDPNTSSSATNGFKIWSIKYTLLKNEVLNIDKVLFLIEGEPSKGAGVIGF